MAIRYSIVTMVDDTIYSETKGYKIVRFGDTVVVKLMGHGNMVIKTMHIPWLRVREAEFISIVSDSETGIK